jgi:hypothetical protein
MKITIPRQIFTGFVVIAAISVACACPGTPQISDLLGGDEAIEELQQTALVMLTELPIEGLEETAIAAMTDVPAEDLMKTAESFATILPDGEGIMETAAAEFGVIPGFGNGDDPGDMQGSPPPDIPVLEDADILVANQQLVHYTSTKPQAEAVEFYKVQMPANGWDLLEEHTNETDNSVILTYKKPNRTALVAVTHLNGVTTVTVSIQTN